MIIYNESLINDCVETSVNCLINKKKLFTNRMYGVNSESEVTIRISFLL